MNLIPFNPFPGTHYRRSRPAAIQRFRDELLQRGVLATVRRTRGEDIDAACGQLAGRVIDRTTVRLGNKVIGVDGPTMSMQLQDTSRLNVVRLAVTGTLALICVACATSGGNSLHTSHANDQKDAAAYNVQLGIDYMKQGDLARAKDKLDRAVKENPSNADVHTARAQLFERMGEIKQADDEYRTALRLAPQ